MHPATARLLERPQWTQRTPEWFAVRRELLTASDAAAALGEKPYPSYRTCPRADALKKKVDDAPVHNMFVAHGQFYEQVACDWAAAALGETVLEVGLVRHATEPWLAASPDGVTLSGKLLEIKCPLKRAIQPGVVPGHYLAQIQVQMECCDMDETIFVQYKPAYLTDDGKAYLDTVTVKRDRDWFEAHRPALRAFWEDFTAAVAVQAATKKRKRGELEQGDEPAAPPPGCTVRDDMYDDLY